MEALMTRLVQTERALMETRQQVASGEKVAAPLVDTRTIGKAPTFTGEHKDWPEWSIQFTAYMGSANPSRLKHCAGLRWRKTRSQPQRGAQSSAASCRGTAVQRKCPGDSEEH